jgi:hypothetical protein
VEKIFCGAFGDAKYDADSRIVSTSRLARRGHSGCFAWQINAMHPGRVLQMIQSLVSELGARLLGEKAGDLNKSVKTAEQMVAMSANYRDLLLEFGGAIWFDNGARYRPESPNNLTGSDGYNDLEILFGLGNGENGIERKAAQYAGELPASFVPIGEAAGGNLICMNGEGAVFFWDHESPRHEPTWRIAASIDEFLRRLEPGDSEVGSTGGIIKSESFLDF